jgi:hypothetical protein
MAAKVTSIHFLNTNFWISDWGLGIGAMAGYFLQS